jgi:alanine racemase
MPAASDRPLAGSARPSQTILTVDLDAIAANYRTLRAQLMPGTACAGVVKADAYGLGARYVVPALAAAGCSEFFVAHLGEAAAIRDVVPEGATVYVLNGLLVGEEYEFVAGGFVPVLNTLEQIDRWATAARTTGQRLPAVVHVDTGMSRLGLPTGETQALIADPGRLAGLDVRYLMSHLACADEPNEPLNLWQLSEFRVVRAAFPQLRASLANSSGIFLGPEYHFDLARPGCALYGINPLPGRPNPVGAVARLDGKILQIHEVDPPRTVGYGATHRVVGRTRIATVAAGYADGWPRSLSNRGSAFAGDIRVPVIGRVSMDLTTLDVTAVPHLRPGDTLELMGPHLSVDEVADAAATIGYEILTRLGRRYQRVYLGGAGGGSAGPSP